MAIRLVSATEDSNSKAVLAFQWDAFVPSSGLSLASYTATLWADAGRTAPVAGGAAQTRLVPSVTFGGVPRGLPFLLDVTAVDASGALGPTVSLLQVAPGDVLPGQLTFAGQDGAGSGEGDDVDGVLAPLRPVYGTVDGVKRWARVVTFGDAKGQVSALDVLYFLMVASDDADGLFAERYSVPLTQYRDASGQFRYPPSIPGLIERKAAGLLLYSRKSGLTEAESSTATGLMTYADKQIALLAQKSYLLGQTMMRGMLPQVYCPAPRMFTMAGDPAGFSYSPTAQHGTSDVSSLRQHGLPYVGIGWRFGSGFGPGGNLTDGAAQW